MSDQGEGWGPEPREQRALGYVVNVAIVAGAVIFGLIVAAVIAGIAR